MTHNNESVEGRFDQDDCDDELAALVADYMDRLHDGGRVRRKDVLRDHPDLGPQIMDELQFYIELESPRESDEVPLGQLGDYTLRRQIGRGGMGVVYEAWQASVERPVALKVLPAGIAADNKAFLRFMREAKTAAQLSHPNVVHVHGMGVEENTPYYAMEYVEGKTLAKVLARIKDADDDTETPFGPKNRQDFFIRLGAAFADVADGLQHAHSKGVTHRDIKPSNLILDSDGRLRILDFGLARLEGQESLTLSGDFVGTPLYMSPEQARRKKIPVDHRTDVYSLGATMYEAMCGRPLFRGKDHVDTLSQIIERDPVEPRKVNPRVPKDLETIVLKCLRKDAGDRYGTAEALGQDVRRFVGGDPIEAKPASSWERFTRRWRQHWKVSALAVLLPSLLIGTWAVVETRLSEFERTTGEVRSLQELGLEHAHARRFEEAIEAFTEAIRRSPDHVTFHHRARAYAEMGSGELAIDDLARSILANPELSLRVYHDLRRASQGRVDPAAARRALDRLIAAREASPLEDAGAQLESRMKLRRILAEVSLRAGDPDGAARAIMEAWGISPRGYRHAVCTLSVLRSCDELADTKGDTSRPWQVEFSEGRKQLERLVASELDPPVVAKGELVHLALSARANAKLTENFHVPDFSPKKTLAELLRGEPVIGGVSFRIEDALIQLRGRDLPSRPGRIDGIEVGETFQRLHVLHGTGWNPPDGTVIGRYEVLYADGSKASIPVVYGVDVRNWDWDGVTEEAVSRGKLAWLGASPSVRINLVCHRLYLLTWENPEPTKEVRAIHCVSTEGLAAPFCVAMTVEKAASAAAEGRSGE